MRYASQMQEMDRTGDRGIGDGAVPRRHSGAIGTAPGRATVLCDGPAACSSVSGFRLAGRRVKMSRAIKKPRSRPDAAVAGDRGSRASGGGELVAHSTKPSKVDRVPGYLRTALAAPSMRPGFRGMGSREAGTARGDAPTK